MIVNFMRKELANVAVIGVLLCAVSYSVHGVSVSCMMAYDEGGAPAVFSSPECPLGVLSPESSENSMRNCQFATLQGHREYQEDRVACNLDMKLPLSDEAGVEEIAVGIAAIFDGHGGEEASEMASTKLFDYFILHVVFTAYKLALPSNKENHDPHALKSSQRTPHIIHHYSLHPILEEALLRTIHDIDSEFSKEALEEGYVSGSTATIVLLSDGQFLVANVGDSKAILCSSKVHVHHHAEAPSIEDYAEELTRDHHPDREDEKARIEAAGGFVRVWGVPRVNGVLAVSRAIGDVFLKRYGVTADPEIAGWRQFTPENRYLVVASDGIFETLTPHEVCILTHGKASESSSGNVSSSSLADWIIRHAFRTGSTDNLSAIVISDLHNCTKDRCDRERKLTN
ncbi:probable protein phosphatase 2C 51 isoform X2 [Sesamum indicum]|uniref:Probable protein phosphatase 2C 51 isoform X2 n=1 Tax=Sesamum indicum TaxID=4182 RepID=A0A6I9T746_SESIN|nr:probable protein phosphatase 2C 51 isoform X2 [Sesamum indicum]